MSSMFAVHETACEKGPTEREKNDLASRVAIASRKADSPINAYHARADIDEHIRQGHDFYDLPAIYSEYYGRAV